MKRTVRKIELLSLVLMLGLGLSAATITVGKTGAAYTKIQDGINAAIAGDTVTVAASTTPYNELVLINKSITLIGAPGAIIDGTGLSTASSGSPFDGDAGLVKITASNVTLQGFEIRNFATTSASDVPSGIRIIGGVSHILVSNNQVHNITTSESSTSHNAHGIVCYGTSTTSNTDINIVGNQVYSCKLGQSESVVVNGNVNGFTIANNTIHDNDNIGIDAIGYEGVCSDTTQDTARNGWIFGNYVYNISDANNNAYPSSDKGGADGIYADGGNHILMERNIVDNCCVGMEAAAEHGGKATDSIVIRNNYVSRCTTFNFAMGGYSAWATSGDNGNGKATNIVLVNNTSYLGTVGIEIQNTAQTVLIANNIIIESGSTPYIGIGDPGTNNTGLTIKNNMYYGASSSSSGDFTDSAPIFRNPLLVSPYANMDIGSGSPAIDAGLALGTIASPYALPVADAWATAQGYLISTAVSGDLDVHGAARVQGSAIDIGADEYGGVQAVAVSISPTSAGIVTNATQQFTATVTGSTNTAVTWTATGGTVSSAGLYTAPATAGTYTVKATSVADTSKSAAATVTVTTAPVVTVVISPTSASLTSGTTKQFTATVTGSTNTAVTWTATGGTVSSAGLYTAPATAGTYTVKATSVADTSKSATATVTVTAASTFTIGYTTAFTSTDNGNANYLKAMKVTLSKAATIQSLAMYIGTKGGQLTLGIYSDASGSPGTLMATTASFTPATGWNTVATSTHPSLAAGSYWLVFETNSNTQAQRYQTGSVAIKNRAYTYATLPSSFGTASSDWSVNYSLYATLQ